MAWTSTSSTSWTTSTWTRPRLGSGAVIYGHTHTPRIERRGAVLYMNPGSAGPRRSNLPVTLARMFIEREGLRVEIVDLVGDAQAQRGS